MEEGLCVKRQTDEITGLSSISVMDRLNDHPLVRSLRPAITLVDGKGKEV